MILTHFFLNPRLTMKPLGLGEHTRLACRGRRPRRPPIGILATSCVGNAKQSAMAPTATREGVYAPQGGEMCDLGEDQDF
jgi:hypothetical protein